MKELPKGKAPDIKGLTIEHLLFADEDVIDLIRELLNTVIKNIDWSSYPLINLGVATMLYKGKGKDMTDPKAFRRIQIACLWSKLLQRLTSGQLGIQTSIRF